MYRMKTPRLIRFHAVPEKRPRGLQPSASDVVPPLAKPGRTEA